MEKFIKDKKKGKKRKKKKKRKRKRKQNKKKQKKKKVIMRCSEEKKTPVGKKRWKNMCTRCLKQLVAI